MSRFAKERDRLEHYARGAGGGAEYTGALMVDGELQPDLPADFPTTVHPMQGVIEGDELRGLYKTAVGYADALALAGEALDLIELLARRPWRLPEVAHEARQLREKFCELR